MTDILLFYLVYLEIQQWDAGDSKSNILDQLSTEILWNVSGYIVYIFLEWKFGKSILMQWRAG